MKKVIAIVLAILMVGVALAGCVEETKKKKNKPPVAEFTVSNENPTHNELFTLDATTSTDPDKKDVEILEFEWDMGDGNKVLKSKGNKVVTHFYEDPGTYEVSLLVFDKKTFTAAYKNLTVVNTPPKVNSFYPADNVTITELETVEFGINASDINEDPLLYQWVLDTTNLTGETSKTLLFTPPIDSDPGAHKVQVRISDGRSFIYQEWNVEILNKNQAPLIVTYSPIAESVTLAEMLVQTFSVTASDPDDDPLTYAWYFNDVVIAGKTTKTYEYQPDYNGAGSYVIRVDVSDGDLITSVSWNVTVTNTNRPPVIASGTPSGVTAEVDEGATIAFSVTASDPDDDVLTYSWAIDSTEVIGQTNSSFTYAPDMSAAGTHSVTATVSDGKGGTDTNTWSVTVNGVNQPPIISSSLPATDPTIDENQDQAFSVTASDPDGDQLNYQWFVNGTAVSGKTTNAFTFTPDYNMGGDSHTVGIRVSDTSNAEVWRNWTVTVNNVNRPPVADASVNMTKPGIGLDVEFDASASTDPDGDTISFIWSFGDGTSPQAGMTVSHSYRNPGIYNAKVTVSDGTDEDIATVQVDVNYTESWMSQDLGVSGPVAVADVDNDGTMEIVVGVLENENAGSYTGYVYIFDGSNHNQEFKSNNIGAVLDIKIGNVDSDNALEIVVGTMTTMSMAGSGFDTSGNLLVFDGSTHNLDFDSGDIGRTTAVGIGDLDNDATNEVIAAHSDYFGNTGGDLEYFGNVTIAEWDGSGWLVLWTTPSSVGLATCLDVDDLDGSGKDNVLLGMFTTLEGSSGNMLGAVVDIHHTTNYVVKTNNPTTGRVVSLTIADPDKDSNLEVVIGLDVKALSDHEQGYVNVLDHTLSLEWSSNDIGSPNSIVVADVDNDNINEIVFGVYYNATEDSVDPSVKHIEGFLYILNGQNHNQKFKSQDIGGVMAIGVGSLDGDNTLEIVVGTWNKRDGSDNLDGYIYVFFYNSSSTSFQKLWRSRNVGQVSLRSIVIADVDGDGNMDFVVATTSKDAAPLSGKLYVYSNKNRA